MHEPLAVQLLEGATSKDWNVNEYETLFVTSYLK